MRLNPLWSLLVLGISFSGCYSPVASRPLAIIGDDGRQAVEDTALQAAVGTLHAGGSALCTAFAISETEVVTAAHCLNPDVEESGYSIHTRGEGFRHLHRITSLYEKADIVVFEAIDTTSSYFPLADTAPGPDQAQLVGFDFKTLAVVNSNDGVITEAKIGSGVFDHTFDTLPGESGSPIIQNGKVVAIHVGSTASGGSNIAVGAAMLKTADVQSVYADYLPEQAAPLIAEAVELCLAHSACASAAWELYQKSWGAVSSFIKDLMAYAQLQADRKAAMDAAAKEYMEHSHNETPGGWAGGDGGGGAGSTALVDFSLVPADKIPGYVGAWINLIYQMAANRDANSDEFKVMGGHIANGGSYGFLKSQVFAKIPVFVKKGNNGAVSCDAFCGGREYEGGVGSCVRAWDTVAKTSNHCAQVRGVQGGEVTCQCLSDGFSKPSNNGSVSCRDYCYGAGWGEIGNCLSAYNSANVAISCDDVTGKDQACICGGFQQH